MSKCFDLIDHDILIRLLRSRIKDERFTRLVIKALKAGYLEFKELKTSLSGTPQGSIISPILSNIYLSQLDKFIEKKMEEFQTGDKPKPNPA